MAETLGVPVERVRRVRKDSLVEGAHYSRGERGVIQYLEAGFERVGEVLGVPEVSRPPEKNGGGLGELVVGRRCGPRHVKCLDGEGRPTVLVLVRDSRKMLPGTRLFPCRPDGPPGSWRYLGVLPRRRDGRWTEDELRKNRALAERLSDPKNQGAGEVPATNEN